MKEGEAVFVPSQGAILEEEGISDMMGAHMGARSMPGTWQGTACSPVLRGEGGLGEEPENNSEGEDASGRMMVVLPRLPGCPTQGERPRLFLTQQRGQQL